jgi:Sec-independent protein translocase protein TatA
MGSFSVWHWLIVLLVVAVIFATGANRRAMNFVSGHG